jgi:hypothetical protein
MVIEGLSQTTGTGRAVEIAAADAGVRVVIRKDKAELGRIDVPSDPLLAVMTDRPAGVQKIAGGERTLEVEVRRNEVWLKNGVADAAVGLDDMTDAVAEALPS